MQSSAFGELPVLVHVCVAGVAVTYAVAAPHQRPERPNAGQPSKPSDILAIDDVRYLGRTLQAEVNRVALAGFWWHSTAQQWRAMRASDICCGSMSSTPQLASAIDILRTRWRPTAGIFLASRTSTHWVHMVNLRV